MRETLGRTFAVFIYTLMLFCKKRFLFFRKRVYPRPDFVFYGGDLV